MKVKISRGEKIFRVFNYVFLTLLTLVCLYPMWHVVMGSFSNSADLMAHSGLLLKPAGFSLESYKAVFENPSIWTGYKNILIIMVIGLPLQLILTALAAYFFSRKKVLLRRPLMLLVLFTMYFSGGTIPYYLNLKDLHLTGNIGGVILPTLISTYNLIVLRTAFESIPDSLTEAAQIDGAGHYTILFRIILPLSKATIAVIALYYGVATWNRWFWEAIILRDRDKYPLQVVLRDILISNDLNTVDRDVESIAVGIKYATIIVATVPILMIYPMIQKHFTKGVMVGAVKE